MKMLLIPLCIALIIVSVDAQQSINVSKPIVSLEKRPRPMTWLRPPEERRKLSIFPKKDLKFVITPKTVVKNDETEEISTGLPTKRPLMRKFTVYDKSKKNSWYFAPREPLMKTKRFTVTMAPPRQTEIRTPKYSYQKHKDEITAESKKVNTVINNSKARQDLNTIQTNKGNLINASRNKSVDVPSFNSFGGVDKLNDKEGISKQANITIQNQNSSFISNNGKKEVSAIEINKNRDGNEMSMVSKIFTPSNIEEIISATVENRSFDLSDTTIVYQIQDRARNFDVEGSKGNLIDSPNTKLFKILMDNIMNDTANYNYVSDLNFHVDNFTIKSNQSTNKIMEDPPQENVEKNKIRHVTHASNENVRSTDVPQILGNGEINTFGRHELINTKQDNNLKSIKSPLELTETHFLSNQQESSSEHNYENTENYAENGRSTTPLEITTPTLNVLEADLTKLPTENFLENFENSITENIIFQTTFENIKTEDATVGYDVIFLNESLKTEFNNTDEFNDNVQIDELIPVTEVSNLLFNLSEEAKEDVSNESLYDKSNNTMSEEGANESNPIGEDTSNEVLSNKSNNYTNEVSNETREHDLSMEEVSYDSNMAGEAISNESSDKSNNLTEEASSEPIIDKSINYTDEVSNESTVHKTNKLTDEEISNESNMAGEEISNESTEKSNNLTEELLNSEAVIDISLTNEYLSEESLKDISDELSAFKPQPYLSAEYIVKNRFKRSRNIIEEEIKATTISGFKYIGHEVQLGHNLNYKNINA